MALECLANRRANSFAAADLTLMRSLRVKNAEKLDKNAGEGPAHYNRDDFAQSLDPKSPLQDCQHKRREKRGNRDDYVG